MKTIIQLFENSVEHYPNNPFLWEKREKNYTSQSYKELHTEVLLLASGLYAIGIKKGDCVGLLSEGRNAWVLSELGILYTGAVNVPLSVKLDAQNELKFRLQHSESRLVFVSKNQLSKIREIKADLDFIEQIIVIDDDVALESKEIYLSSIIQFGQNLPENDKNDLIKIWSVIEPDDNANISYTSGTTADPKGIILSHNNYTSNVIQASSLMNIPETYKTLLILPWDHSFAHTAGIYSFMLKGASIAAVQQGKVAYGSS